MGSPSVGVRESDSVSPSRGERINQFLYPAAPGQGVLWLLPCRFERYLHAARGSAEHAYTHGISGSLFALSAVFDASAERWACLVDAGLDHHGFQPAATAFAAPCCSRADHVGYVRLRHDGMALVRILPISAEDGQSTVPLVLQPGVSEPVL